MVLFILTLTVPTPFPIADPATTTNASEESARALFSDLPSLQAWLAQWASACQLEERMLKRLQLCLEELFANSIHHGYRGESDAPIRLKLDRSPERVRLTYADRAPAFNLLHVARLPADSERLGGVGLNLIRALTNRIQYQHEAGWNITTLEFTTLGETQKSLLSN